MAAAEKFNPEDFLIFHPSFRKIFEHLDEESNPRKLMKKFLTKFKAFYKETDLLMDFQGLDNVLFYKDGPVWKYKVDSMLKQETEKEARAMLQEIANNPSAVNESFKK